MGDGVVSAAFAGPARPMNVPLMREPLTVYDEENVTFFPQLESNDALRDAVHSSGYGSVSLSSAKIESRKRDIVQRVLEEEAKTLTFKPDLNPAACKNGYEVEIGKAKKQLMKTINSSGYATHKGSNDAWLNKATDKLIKTNSGQKPKLTVGPDGAKLFQPKMTKTKTATRIASEISSSGYGRKIAAPKAARERNPRPDFKPQIQQTAARRRLKKEAPSSSYGKTTAPFRVGYRKEGGHVRQVTDNSIDKYNGMAAPSNKLTARRRLSCSSLLDDSRMQARPKETPPEVTAREAGFVLDGVRVTHACPLRSKFVEASDDPIGSVYVRPRPLAALDDAALAMRETYVSSVSSSGYGPAYTPEVGRIQENGDARLAWDSQVKKWVVQPKDLDGWEYDTDANEWVQKEDPMQHTRTVDRPAFDVRGILAKPKAGDLDAWLRDNPKNAALIGDVAALDAEDEEETQARVGLGNMCLAAKPLPKVPKGYYGHAVKVGSIHSSQYGGKVPGWEYDDEEGCNVAVASVPDGCGSVQKVRLVKKVPRSESDHVARRLHGGTSFLSSSHSADKFQEEPAEKEIAWREAVHRKHLRNEVGSHGYGVVFPEVAVRPESPPHHCWKPPSLKATIPEPENYPTTALSRNAVGHYGPGYDPAAGNYVDAMYAEEASEEDEEEEEGDEESGDESEGSEA